MSTLSENRFDFLVVGSGPGGGPLAANLARRGFRVLLLEAGDDHMASASRRTAELYSVPAFHPLCSEDANLRWDYFVNHYRARPERDPKYDPVHGGILYPRAATLGGCSAVNALITVCAHDSDWDALARELNDPSWSASRMRRYFQRLERCQYSRRLVASDSERSGHGLDGWLATEDVDAGVLLRDKCLLEIVKAAAREHLESGGGPPRSSLRVLAELAKLLGRDLNDAATQLLSREGLCTVPLATDGRRRNGTREYLLETMRWYPENLVVRTNVLVTRVLFDGTRAVGVRYRRGARIYAADRNVRRLNEAIGAEEEVRVRREVILSAGAFNTPQILLQSGVGPRVELARHGIEPVVPLEGVGNNLQDRYEVAVVSEMRSDFEVLADCRFDATDPQFEAWRSKRGVYTGNGAAVAMVKKSRAAGPDDEPDLFIFGLPSFFAGYQVDYSKRIRDSKRHFTWVILKAHTRNRAGTVRLAAPRDPLRPPEINFNYFDRRDDPEGRDMAALVEGVKLVREIMSRVDHLTRLEHIPGGHVRSDEEIAEFIEDNAWGHHACGTCAMGSDPGRGAVVDAQFRVHGTRGLRVVDASIFPAIPGFFIALPVYMVSEKASDVIAARAVAEDAERAQALVS